jgi:hypothetical protein
MSFDLKRMQKNLDDSQAGAGGDFFNPEVGDTRVYIHGMVYPEDTNPLTAGIPYVEVETHYKVGGKMMAICLDPEANPIITHPTVKKFLAERTKKPITKLGKVCGVCKAIADGDMDEDSAHESRRQKRYLMGVTPVDYRKKKVMDWLPLEAKPGVIMSGKQLWEGVTNFLIDGCADGGDVTDPRAAILAMITKTGAGMTTKYEVKVDGASSKTPLMLPKATRLAIKEAMKPGGGCDLLRLLASMLKGPDEIAAALEGVEIEEDEDEDEPAPKVKPKAKAKPEPEEDDEPEEAEEEEAEEEPAPKPKAKKPPPPPDDDDDEPEEEEAPAPKPKVKAKAKPEPEEEEEAEEEAEEDEPAPAPKVKAKAKPAPEEDEQDDDLSAIDAELEAMSGKKTKTKAK